jgi:hypothetical protein
MSRPRQHASQPPQPSPSAATRAPHIPTLYFGTTRVSAQPNKSQGFDVPVGCEFGEGQRIITNGEYNTYIEKNARKLVQPGLRDLNPTLHLHTPPIRVADHTLTPDYSEEPCLEERQKIIEKYGTLRAYDADIEAYSHEYPAEVRQLLQEGRDRDQGKARFPAPVDHTAHILKTLKHVRDNDPESFGQVKSTHGTSKDVHVSTASYASVKKYRNILERDMEEIRTWYSDLQARKKQQERLQSMTRVWFEDARNLNISRGEQIFELAYVLFDMFGSDWERTPEQCRFHDHILELCAPLIYKDDFQKHRNRLLKRFKKRTFAVAVFFAGPRRWGKSVGLGQDGAVTLYIGRGIKTVTFAQTLGIACELVNKVRMFFLRLPDAEKRILRTTSVEFLVSWYHEEVKGEGERKRLIMKRRFNKMMARSCIANSQYRKKRITRGRGRDNEK